MNFCFNTRDQCRRWARGGNVTKLWRGRIEASGVFFCEESHLHEVSHGAVG